MPRKDDFHFWCTQVRARGPNSHEATLMTLAEREYARHDKVAKSCKTPGKSQVRRSFQDVTAGMRQIGASQYDLYDDFTFHVLNRASPPAAFLFPTIKEGCERYGRTRVHDAPSVGVQAPTPRTPQEWKWGPQNVLITPSTKTVKWHGRALKLVSPGVYSIPEIRLTVRTHISDTDFRQYVSTAIGKIDIISKFMARGVFGVQIHVPDIPVTAPLPATG